MGSQLGWVHVSKALGAGRPGARRSGWSDDEQPLRGSRREAGTAGRALPRVVRSGRARVLIALVALTIVSWAVTAGATAVP
jgi:hypothetical protein